MKVRCGRTRSNGKPCARLLGAIEQRGRGRWFQPTDESVNIAVASLKTSQEQLRRTALAAMDAAAIPDDSDPVEWRWPNDFVNPANVLFMAVANATHTTHHQELRRRLEAGQLVAPGTRSLAVCRCEGREGLDAFHILDGSLLFGLWPKGNIRTDEVVTEHSASAHSIVEILYT